MDKTMNKPRFISVDVMKGLAMVCMAIIHGCFFFKAGLLSKLFIFIDPFVFPTFLFCFGIGNGLSRRIKNISVLGKLALVYLVGGFPSGIVYLIYKHPNLDISKIHIHVSQQFLNALTLQERIAYADFLVPFMISYALFLGIQYVLREFNLRSLGVAIFISILFYAAGQGLAAVAPNFFLRDLYSQGFRVFQNLPIFMAGVCSGLWLRKYGLPKLNPHSTKLVTAMLFLGIGYFYIAHERYSYVNPGVTAWKKSGELSYVLAGILIPITLMLTIEGLASVVTNNKYLTSTLSLLKRIGENTFKCLWLQFLILPILGLFCSTLLPELLRLPVLGLAVALIVSLTVGSGLEVTNGFRWRKKLIPSKK
jgi:hypothetical protein